MKVSYNWIKQYVDLTDITPEYLADKLTNAGLEVEEVKRLAFGTNLVVGSVLECDPHPDSDHLHVCMVDIKDETLQIVCGAPNVKRGQKVIVAKVDAVLPEITIKEGMIRGVRSQGMICSLSELGVDKKLLNEQQLNGIEVLPDGAIVGDDNPLSYIGLDDVLIDISLTPNRADCQALFALAYEIKAILKRETKLPNYHDKSKIGKPSDLHIKVTTPKCPLFIGKIINDLKIKPSPQWLKDALLSVGIKSINNVVDISNYVMLETGQPLHFYDLSKLKELSIGVCDDIKMSYEALDNNSYHIEKGDLMIVNGDAVIGIAGIMGGQDSKIEDNTTQILIEAATFDLASIRNTARRLNLTTEASMRFQKGIDPLAPQKAVDRAVELLIDLADATDLEANVVYGDINTEPYEISISTKFINDYLATNFSTQVIMDVFADLSLKPKLIDDQITVCIPSYRTDLRLKVDLCEEVVRLLGYDSVPSTLPAIYEVSGAYADNAQLRYQIKDMLKVKGMAEIITYSLVSERHVEHALWYQNNPVVLANPLSEDRKYYRSSLFNSMLDTIAYNQARFIDEFMFFEIADIYDENQEREEHLCMGFSSSVTINKWKHEVKTIDFFTVKGIIYGLLNQFGFDDKRISVVENTTITTVFNPYQSALVYLDKECLGVFGRIHPQYKDKYDVKDVMIAELNLSVLYNAKSGKIKFKPIPRYPMINYDLALIVDENTKAETMISAIKKIGGKLVVDVSVFDVYKGDKLPDGKKSIAFSIIYQAMDKTLNDIDIQPIQAEILNMLKTQFKAVLRDS